MEGPCQPKCHALAMLSRRTGERKSCSLEANQQNLPKFLMVGSRDQERFIGETSTVFVVENIAGLIGARGDDEKCGLKGLSPPSSGSPGCVATIAGCLRGPRMRVEAALACGGCVSPWEPVPSTGVTTW